MRDLLSYYSLIHFAQSERPAEANPADRAAGGPLPEWLELISHRCSTPKQRRRTRLFREEKPLRAELSGA
jgi:hypothetical protein